MGWSWREVRVRQPLSRHSLAFKPRDEMQNEPIPPRPHHATHLAALNLCTASHIPFESVAKKKEFGAPFSGNVGSELSPVSVACITQSQNVLALSPANPWTNLSNEPFLSSAFSIPGGIPRICSAPANRLERSATHAYIYVSA